MSWRFTGASETVDLGDGMKAACLIPQAAADLTLSEAFAYGCPAAFESYQLTEAAVATVDMLSPYAFNDPLTLAGFPQREAIEIVTETDSLSPDLLESRNVLGQGDLTTTPLHLATIVAAIANDGLAAKPALLAGLRMPNSQQWQTAPGQASRRRMMDSDTAQGLRLVLQDTRTKLWREPQASPRMGAYIARSYSGDETQLWLNGYVETDNGGAFAFVVLLEDTDDVPGVLSIGSIMFDIFAGM